MRQVRHQPARCCGRTVRGAGCCASEETSERRAGLGSGHDDRLAVRVYARGAPGGPHDRPGDVAAHTREPGPARLLHPRRRHPPPYHGGPTGPGRRPGQSGRPAPPGARAAAPAARPRPGPPTVTRCAARMTGRTAKSPRQAPGRDRPPTPESTRERGRRRGLPAFTRGSRVQAMRRDRPGAGRASDGGSPARPRGQRLVRGNEPCGAGVTSP